MPTTSALWTGANSPISCPFGEYSPNYPFLVPITMQLALS